MARTAVHTRAAGCGQRQAELRGGILVEDAGWAAQMSADRSGLP